MNITSEDIISIIKEEISNYHHVVSSQNIGHVISLGDGIATIYGLDNVMYGEIVIFETGDKGMVQNIGENTIGCILFGDETRLREGTQVYGTGKRAGIPVGEQFIGRVIDPLGTPIDGGPAIESSDFRPIEFDAPPIIARQPVTVPLETGILTIDSMFPIGRGQRELIIGDRQTGKTSIAIDTILNQKGKDVYCIYVAIGQKASTIAQIISTFKKHGSLEYTTVVCATAGDCAPLQYIAPYSATSLAEHFMYQGKDVLIVYDDLSKHAAAYRTISLLLERSPGREAYPGDVFYLHSRLLERSSRLQEALGGGSITALPIIETQAGDVSSYIPTNVISITDGQIFLESGLFKEGIRPAINIGISVSRVGGKAQTDALKKAAGSIRINLAQARELESFTQFSQDLDETTKKQLKNGNDLTMLLKQPVHAPMALWKQVVSLTCANCGLLYDIPTNQVPSFQEKLHQYLKDHYHNLMMLISETKDLTDDTRKSLLDAIEEFKKEFVGNQNDCLEKGEYPVNRKA